MRVHKNGSADATIQFALKQELKRYTADLNPFSSMEDVLRNQGFQIEEFNRQKEFGFEAKRHYHSLRELQGSAATSIPASVESRMLHVSYEEKHSLFFTTYRVRARVDLQPLYDDFLYTFTRKFQAADWTANYIGDELTKQLLLHVRVILPIRASSSNATQIAKGGKELEWKMSLRKVNDLRMEVKVPRIRNFAVAAGTGLLFLIILFVWWKKRRLQKKK
ncbi:hypothetical protein MUG87_03485 [Ectobacillus sp. JY-23]|uniref:hypothetical protein n=1 Tax=Ectobacillus sp. JY-23 TaxID=2933872 RepID=UPI001FF1DE3F|nr:hypothetical protein [Ectobacillus sp. JY-23]UOY93205.1 hypothetical protein MUG87_03485 [Ectobacillus sp. JY-23]